MRSTRHRFLIVGLEDVEPRHREKVGQLRANPYGVDGFAITGGPTRE